ncbi:MAG: DEAD/DEAH box helicase family protein, partial [Nitrospinaceae bacterium]|nr:DEAD/DEAH box helicase family protein [Nitrospinaceae bacterium]
MSFRNLNLPLSVKTTKDDPIQDFFNPVLSQSIEYCVAVGYFSSYWIRDAAEGIAKLASKGGKVRWVISPNLNSDDFEILSNSKSKDEKEEVFESISTRSFEELFEELSQNTRATLSWLIRDRIMDFRVGIPKNKLSGILHSKMGYFVDENGDEISFSGSYNLTNGANSNWERFDVFPEWKSEESSLRTDEIKYDFEAMWNKEDPNLDIYVPTSVVLKKYIMFTDDVDRPYPKPDVEPTHKIAIPEHFLSDGKLRPYQEEAIDKWFKNNGRGIFHMATGSGKTVTALVAAMRLTNHIIGNDGNISIVVAVPFQHLANQWEKEAKEFGFRTVKCFDSVVRWMPKAQKQIMNMLAGEEHYTFFITVNKTLFNDPFQNILSNLKGNILLIGDEMHNLGSSNYKKLLPENAKFRIGLSATPVRKGDEEG